MKLPWPEVPSRQREGETIRQVLDYVIWVTREMLQPAFHVSTEMAVWRPRVQRAYDAIFLPPVTHYGDPYPPEVPPPRQPGTWPDVPAMNVTGMTVRHQLKVILLVASRLRDQLWLHAPDHDVAMWDERLCRAREALEHGPGLPMPEEARTEPSAEALRAAEEQARAVQAIERRRTKRLKQLRAQASRRKAAATRQAKAAARKAPAKKAPARKKAASKAPAAARRPKAGPASSRPAARKKVAARKKAPAKKKPAAQKAPSRKSPARKGGTARKK